MDIPSLRSVAPSLRDAIDTYVVERKESLDRHATDLLARLTKNPSATDAFGRLNLDRRTAATVLTTVIQTEAIARTFPKWMGDERDVLARLEGLDKAVASLRSFVVQQTKQPAASDMLSAWISYDPADVATMKQGLYLVADLIAARRRIAEETRLRIGVTRKNQIRQAGQNAAIGWLAQGVRRITGRPHLVAVADLAQVILGAEIDQERVRRAARAANREWRHPTSSLARGQP